MVFSTFRRAIMRTTLFILAGLLLSVFVFGQQDEAADSLVDEGVGLQDAGHPDSAMMKYNQALRIDKDNLLALAEMAYSLLSVEKYNESISFCKRAIKTHPRDPVLKTVYVSYGNALDGLSKSEKSIEIYNEGIHLFPEYAGLYFNRGISQNALHKTDDALLSFQKSATLDPNHAGSHNAIGHVLFNTNNIPSLLAFCRFMVLEPRTSRAALNLENIQKIMTAHVNKRDEGRLSVSVSPDLINGKTKNQQNDFSSAELMLALSAALDNDSSYMNKTAVEKFTRKFSLLCGYLKETEKDGYGFYWDYYVPYFIEMNDKDLVTTFSYIAFTSSKSPEVVDWLKTHQREIDEFYKWSEGFAWRIN
ncbi:MAG TPA: tetratricopeptide repeat protein [Puia sp.]